MPNSLPLVQLQLLGPLLHGLKARGIDPEPILESVGLTMSACEHAGASVHVMVMHQFVENCAEAAQDVTFCASIGARLDPTGWPMIQLALKQAKTLGEFLNIYVVEATKVASSVTPYVEVRGNTVAFGETRRFEPLVKPAQNDGFMIGLKLAILEKVLGHNMQPEKVVLVLCDPTVLPSRYDGFQTLTGNKMGPKILFPSDWLAMGLSKEGGVSEIRETSSVQKSDDFLAGFRHLLEQVVGNRALNVHEAAALVQMSSKKLNRQLASYGTNASSEISHIKMRYAKDTLSKTDRSIEEIASALGYRDPSNFSRAFSNIYGLSPSQFRKEGMRLSD
ncbi:AraC family transcriptional regulator [uncultured Shimia sp.]|uniref:AraC family transcriptional regulator n=1 Tax=uncultured Shimia sp. TaxID=573152 RepID=UPI0026342AE6|nr:AraC family transcriptional regulator [uncultured Shimia sp.]